MKQVQGNSQTLGRHPRRQRFELLAQKPPLPVGKAPANIRPALDFARRRHASPRITDEISLVDQESEQVGDDAKRMDA
ncbi:hypothetical protein [Cupriavidus basilensis]